MKFTIVTPSFNQLSWLKMAIASVRDQLIADADGTSREAEGIATMHESSDRRSISVEHIIQDAKTPGIENFAREMNAELILDGRIAFSCAQSLPKYNLKIYSERDFGMYDAINRGLARANGDIAAWLNCDEQYLPGTLEAVSSIFSTSEHLDILFGDAILLNGECKPYSYRRVVLPSLDYLRTVSPNLFSCSTFFRTEIYRSGICFDRQWKIIGDAVWFHKVLSKGYRARVLHKALATFTITGENLSELRDKTAEEWKNWRQLQHSAPFLPRFALILLQRIKKLLAGAYVRRRIDISVYRPDQLRQRTSHQIRAAFGWRERHKL